MNQQPTEKQQALAERLGVWQAGMSRADCSAAIDAALAVPSPEMESFARSLGIWRDGMTRQDCSSAINEANDPMDMLRRLDAHYDAAPDRRGERHVACPWCKKEPSPKHPNFSYGQRGGGCYSCGGKAALWGLLEAAGLAEGYTPPPTTQEARQKPAQGRSGPPWWWSQREALLARYTANERRVVALWQQHKPLAAATIREWRLGVGVLPSCACKHERLILPVVERGEVVSFRGRTISCDCARWLQAGGGRVALYNRDGIREGGVLWIVENNVDAILFMERYPDWDAVASTNGAGTWRDEWTQHIASRKPSLAIVALDHDIAGNGGGAERRQMIQAWREAHPNATALPVTSGPRLAQALLQAGVPARLYQYPRGTLWKSNVVDALVTRQAAA